MARKLSKRPAFTLVECLVALSVLGMIVLLAQFSVKMQGQMVWQAKAERQVDKVVMQLENPSEHYRIEINQSMMLKKDNKHYQLKAINNSLKLVGDQGGQIVLLNHVSNCQLTSNSHGFMMNLTYQNVDYQKQVVLPYEK